MKVLLHHTYGSLKAWDGMRHWLVLRRGLRQAEMQLMGMGVCQGVLVSYIGHIRTNTAKWTDERVRLAGEAISGCLAVKMLGALHIFACCVLLHTTACWAVLATNVAHTAPRWPGRQPGEEAVMMHLIVRI